MDCCGSSRARRAALQERAAKREAVAKKKEQRVFDSLARQAGCRAADMEAQIRASAHLKEIHRLQVESEFEARLSVLGGDESGAAAAVRDDPRGEGGESRR